MKKLVISVLLINLLAACASQTPKESAADSKAAPISDATQAADSSTASASSATTPAVSDDALNDPKNTLLAKRSVYYPLDVYTVQDADKPTVQAHAKYLGEHANRKVRLEGNCDERGSTEYNLALGQRRADGVKKILVVGGAKESQLDAISYGEEKPKASGHDETSWAQNRRTDMNYGW